LREEEGGVALPGRRREASRFAGRRREAGASRVAGRREAGSRFQKW
jgi:hypothetical protein